MMQNDFLTSGFQKKYLEILEFTSKNEYKKVIFLIKKIIHFFTKHKKKS